MQASAVRVPRLRAAAAAAIAAAASKVHNRMQTGGQALLRGDARLARASGLWRLLSCSATIVWIISEAGRPFHQKPNPRGFNRSDHFSRTDEGGGQDRARAAERRGGLEELQEPAEGAGVPCRPAL